MADPVGALQLLWNKQNQDKANMEAGNQRAEASFVNGLNALNNANKQYGSLFDLKKQGQIKQELASVFQNAKTPEEELKGIMAVGAKYGGFGGMDKQIQGYINVLGKTMSKSKLASGQSVAEQKFNLEQEEKTKQQDFEAQTIKDSALDTLKTIEEVEKRMGSFGLWGDLPSIPGTPRKNWEVNVNKLLSGKIIDLMNTMKRASKTGATGFGQLSGPELAVLQGASTALKRSLAPKDAQRYINQIKASLNKVAQNKQYIKTGTYKGKRVGQLPDGSIEVLE